MKTQFQQNFIMSCEINRNQGTVTGRHRKQDSCLTVGQITKKCSPIKSFNSLISLNQPIFSKQRELLNQNPNPNQKLLDFKKHLHKSQVTTNTERSQVNRQQMRVNKFSEIQSKKKLQSKMQEAFQKLQALKQTVKKHQRDKAQILARSDRRKANKDLQNMLQDSF